jgi:hypothetical protein
VLHVGVQNTYPCAISSVEKALQISAMVGADTTALKNLLAYNLFLPVAAIS